MTLIARKYFFVYTKATWQGSWQLQSYMTPLSVFRSLSPQIDKARLKLNWGTGTWENGATMADASNMPNLSGYYVKITIDDAAVPTDEMTIFVGVIQNIDYDLLGQTLSSIRSADQFFNAYGLESLLEQHIQKSRVRRSGTTYLTKKVQTFNRRAAGGQIAGNRSAEKYPTDLLDPTAGATYIFETNATDVAATDVWTNRDILEYVLAFNQLPDGLGGPRFQLEFWDNTAAYLDEMVNVWDVSKLTTRQVINAIVNRARGLAWRCTVVDDAVKVQIYSMIDSDLTIAGVTVPQNTTAIFFDAWSTKTTPKAVIKQDDRQRYDRIIVTGSNIKVCGTFSLSAGELEIGWTSTLETAYKDAAKNTTGYDSLDEEEKKKLNDNYRATDRFNNVFSLFRVPSGWDWTLNSEIAAPSWDPFSRVLEPDNITGYWTPAKRFLSLIPFKEGVDYSGTSESDENVSGSDAEFRRPFVIAQNDDSKWVYLDKLENTPAAVRMLQTELGVSVRFKPAYLFSGTSDSGFEVGYRTGDLSEDGISYSTLKLTAMLETDEAFEARYVDRENEFMRTKTIHVPDAELWYIVPGTVVDVEDDGAVKTFGGASKEIRNDIDKLAAILAAAAAWYTKTRYKVTLRNETLIEAARLGELLEVADPNDPDGGTVGSIVTAITYNLAGARPFLVLQTDNAEIDIAAVYGATNQNAPAAIPSLSVAAREISGIKKDIDTVRTELNKNPLRIEPGGGGSNATKIRKAYAKNDAGSGATITCYLDTDATGDEITVNCEIVGGSALNSAVPRLEDGDLIHVWNDGGTWRAIMTFQASGDCS